MATKEFTDADLAAADATTKERRDAGVFDAYKAADLTSTEDGEEFQDETAFNSAAYEVLRKARVRSEEEKPAKALTKAAFAAAVFAQTPGRDDWHQLSFIQRKVWEALERKVWSAASATGILQELMGVKDKGLVICHAKVALNGVMVPVVYVTDDIGLIRDDYLKPREESVKRATAKISNATTLAIARHPEHEAILRKAALLTMSAARTRLKDDLALTSGDGADGES